MSESLVDRILLCAQHMTHFFKVSQIFHLQKVGKFGKLTIFGTAVNGYFLVTNHSNFFFMTL